MNPKCLALTKEVAHLLLDHQLLMHISQGQVDHIPIKQLVEDIIPQQDAIVIVQACTNSHVTSFLVKIIAIEPNPRILIKQRWMYEDGGFAFECIGYLQPWTIFSKVGKLIQKKSMECSLSIIYI
ncbi:hypothetical protein SAY86_031843 [Trapa natans]|uniref:Uncharacterized protein n=1 Tax=Trapa natans TaxID=22666 RepID=A0AAN7LSI4_TRANT|nr:hypothetical protein SAY86_031843 [Trapa natans]